MQPPVSPHIIFYESDAGGPQPGGKYGPQVLKARLAKPLHKHYGIGSSTIEGPESESLPRGKMGDRPGRPFNLVENVRVVTELALEVANQILSGRKPVTVGGDHMQGLGTVKGTALAFVAKAIASGEIPVESAHEAEGQAFIRKVQASSIDASDINASLSRLVQSGAVLEVNIAKALSKLHVIWYDAHGDSNTHENSPSGNANGMPLAAVRGKGGADFTGILGNYLKIPSENVYIIGARDLDPDSHEFERLIDDGVHIYGCEQPDYFPPSAEVEPKYRQAFDERMGMVKVPATLSHSSEERAAIERANEHKKSVATILDEVMQKVGPDGYVIGSLDTDAIEGSAVPTSGTPIGFDLPRGTSLGPSLKQSCEVWRNKIRDPRFLAFDISEVDPGVVQLPVTRGHAAELLERHGTARGWPLDNVDHAIRLGERTLYSSTKFLLSLLGLMENRIPDNLNGRTLRNENPNSPAWLR